MFEGTVGRDLEALGRLTEEDLKVCVCVSDDDDDHNVVVVVEVETVGGMGGWLMDERQSLTRRQLNLGIMGVCFVDAPALSVSSPTRWPTMMATLLTLPSRALPPPRAHTLQFLFG